MRSNCTVTIRNWRRYERKSAAVLGVACGGGRDAGVKLSGAEVVRGARHVPLAVCLTISPTLL